MHVKEATARLNEIRVQVVAQWLGISNLPEFGSARCPFPDHPDKKPFFAIQRGGLRWKCYACNRHGGTIDFVATYLNTDFKQARKWLDDRVGNPRVAAPSNRIVQQVVAKSPATNTLDDLELYNALLEKCPLRNSGRSYLESRGFTNETISHFRVGQIPDDNLLSNLLEEFGFERLEAAGLLTKKSTQLNSRLTIRPGYLMFPIIKGEDVVSVQGRQVGPSDGTSKYIYLTGRKPKTYNLDVLETDARDICICEGIPDTMSAHQLGFKAIGLLGISNNLSSNEIAKLKGRRVKLLLDWDEKGESKARSLRSELASHGIVCERKSRPHPQVKDLNEFLMLRSSNDAS